MASQNISIPVAGEPIDLAFMTTLAKYIADINIEILANKKALSSLYTVTGRTTVDTDDVAIWTGVTEPDTIATATAPATKSWGVNYSAEVGFMATPVVTATVSMKPGNSVGVSCWITKTTIGGASGYYRLHSNTTKQETVTINVTAIGPGRVR